MIDTPHRLRACALWLVISAISPALGSALDKAIDRRWANDSFWDQGKAEILVFESQILREGSLRPAEVIQVIVKEDHLPQMNVKTEDWHKKGLVPRIKFNEILTVPTGVYTYRQVVSLFFDRADMRPKKAVVTSQEWCGQTYQELRLEPSRAVLDFSSYWEGEGKGSRTFALEDDLIPANAFPVFLRALDLTTAKTYSVSTFPDMISNRVGKPLPVTAAVIVEPPEEITILGGKKKVVPVRVEWSLNSVSYKERFWFSKDGLHTLLRRQRADGGYDELKKRFVLDYWKYNRPGDEKLLQ